MSITELDEHKSIEQLRKELLVLRMENNAAMLTVDKLLKDLNKKSEEIKHLQSLVSQTVPVISKKKNEPVSAAKEEIAAVQLERLRQIANSRILTLEETRMFDILVKAQNTPNKQPEVITATYRDVSNDALLQLANTLPKEAPNGESDT